jgi:hypothetical protein
MSDEIKVDVKAVQGTVAPRSEAPSPGELTPAQEALRRLGPATEELRQAAEGDAGRLRVVDGTAAVVRSNLEAGNVPAAAHTAEQGVADARQNDQTTTEVNDALADAANNQ